MINIQNVQNVSDCVPLYLPHSLYLKPLARLNISVALPANKTGKSISNLELMDKLSAALKPDKFHVIKVSKSTVDVIRFEAELDDRTHLRGAISRLDGITIKPAGFSEPFRVRASEPKDDFPTRYDWDAFFRDAKNMNEMKAGERPDTIHFTHLPIRWFCPRHMENDDDVKPSESIFKRIFEKFGAVNAVDIPICDPYRHKMNMDINGMKTFSPEHDVLFEAYVQFKEHVGFVRAMDEFRGMKLVRKFVDKTQAINIHVDFDKTKHLSDAQLQRRERVRKRLISKAQAEEEKLEQLKKLEEEKLALERQKEEEAKLALLAKQREREEKRKERNLKKIEERGQFELSQKIRAEERKLKIAQRKLESIRILEHLYDRIQTREREKRANKRNAAEDDAKNAARERLVHKYKAATQNLIVEQRKKVLEIKAKTPLSGLLKSKPAKVKTAADDSSDEDAAKQAARRNLVGALPGDDVPSTSRAAALNATAAVQMPPVALPLNPFKAAAALAGAAPVAGYTPEAANEWMKSLSMFPYMPHMFPGMSALYRPTGFPPVSLNYRGFAPRIRGRGRGGRGRGRGGFDPHAAPSYYHPHYQHYENYADDEGDGGGIGGSYYKSSYSSRSRHRSRTRSYSRSRTRSPSRSRHRHYSKRSKSRSRSRSRRSHSHSDTRSRSWTRSRSKSKPKSKPKLVSTRRSRSISTRARTKASGSSRRRSRSRSTSASSDRSRSRTHKHRAHHRSKRSWTRRGSGERSARRSASRSRSSRSSRSRSRGDSQRVVLETDKLVRSAEEIKRNLDKDLKERMRDEEREIKENFRRPKYSKTSGTPTSANAHEPSSAEAAPAKTPTSGDDHHQRRSHKSRSVRKSYEREPAAAVTAE